MNQHPRPPWWRAYSFVLVTGALFLFSWIGQLVAQWNVVANEAAREGREVLVGEFAAQFWASTLENWQSEFLQLCWQAAGLALLYFWGSSQSREQSDRVEAKLDYLMRAHGGNPQNVDERIASAP